MTTLALLPTWPRLLPRLLPRSIPAWLTTPLATLIALTLLLAGCTTTAGGGGTYVADGSGGGDASAGDTSETADTTAATKPIVVVRTNKGEFVVELDPNAAPITVANFLGYVDSGFYACLLVHRVIDGFMIQGGGMTANGQQKPTGAPIQNEATNGLLNLRGTVAMARTSVINSATSQFFVNLQDNAFLDHKNTTAKDYGYAVFGKVIQGMDIVDAIAKVQTSGKAGNPADKPLVDVVITAIERQ